MTNRRASFLLAFIAGPVLALSANVPLAPPRGDPVGVPMAQLGVAVGQPAEDSAAPDSSATFDAGSATAATATATDSPAGLAPDDTSAASTTRARVTNPPARTTVGPKPRPTPKPTPKPTPAPTPTPTPAPSSTPIAAVQTWTYDIYDSRAVRWQDPDGNACTATVTLSMLNTIYYARSSASLTWQASVLFSTEEDILAWERNHMTMLVSSAGSDPHGMRNALNFYGWGSMTAGMYRDLSYNSLDAATRAIVTAIARLRKPVGILGKAGRHGQFVTGYKVTGDDPRTGSSNFSVVGLYVTDPLQAVGRRDAWTSYAALVSGGTWIAFTPYLESDSPYVDPIDGQVGTTEWHGRWVTLMPAA
jgi:hypothetical protein